MNHILTLSLWTPADGGRAIEDPRQTSATEPAGQGASSRAGRRLRVLVIDDDQDTVESMALFLRLYGHDPDVACDGRSGLRLARERRPDVVLLDLALPGTDGFEVARQLRRQEGPGKVVLVAVTGYADEVHRRRSREAGFDCYLVKPVEPLELMRVIAWCAGMRRPRP